MHTTSTKFLYESGYITLEIDGAGVQTAYNVYCGSSMISRKTTQDTLYYLYNGHGDVVQLTNAWGVVTASYDYDAFGNLLEAYSNDLNPWRYCGEYWDFETKRYNLRTRYYQPVTGRFLTNTIRASASLESRSIVLLETLYFSASLPAVFNKASIWRFDEFSVESCR